MNVVCGRRPVALGGRHAAAAGGGERRRLPVAAHEPSVRQAAHITHAVAEHIRIETVLDGFLWLSHLYTLGRSLFGVDTPTGF